MIARPRFNEHGNNRVVQANANGADGDRARNKLPQRSAENMRRTLMHPRDLPRTALLPVYLLCNSQYREIEMCLVAVPRPRFPTLLSPAPTPFSCFFLNGPGYFIQRHFALLRALLAPFDIAVSLHKIQSLHKTVLCVPLPRETRTSRNTTETFSVMAGE